MKSKSTKILSLHPDYHETDQKINAAFSFGPYLAFLKDRITRGESSPDLYRYIISRFESIPDLVQPGSGMLNVHSDLSQLVFSSLHTLSDCTDPLYYHISVPYRLDIIHQSHSHNAFFYSDDDQFIRLHPGIDVDELRYMQEFLAYRMIFRKCYGINLAGIEETSFQAGHGSSTPRTYRMYVDESFVALLPPDQLPDFPDSVISEDGHVIRDIAMLRQQLPLSLFRFEGFLIRKIDDLRTENTVTDIKGALIEMHTDELGGYDKLSGLLRMILSQPHSMASFVPFIRLNHKYILSDHYASRSVLFSRITKQDDKEQLYDKLGGVFSEDHAQPIVISDTLATSGHGLLDRWLHVLPYRCYLIRPLFDKSAFLGIVEINYESGDHEMLFNRISPIVPYLQLAIRNSIRHFHRRLGDLVKEHFTPVQPAVEWKFAETAWYYMRSMERGVDSEMGTVNFESVFPVYGMIDIRNSSGVRARCTQQDLLGQLDLVAETINAMKEHVDDEEREHLNNILFRNQVMRSRVEGLLLAEEEMRVSAYLEQEIRSMFRHIGRDRPDIDRLAKNYLQTVDLEKGFLYHNRREYDESIGAINSMVTRYLANEEAKLQKIFPHYFDKYKTDGIEYDIYIGESISRSRQFDHMYLRNIRLWQLSSMVEIARRTEALAPQLKIPLQTTQLILAHSQPICITFRSDERRFDVEGGVNIRYELIKKRIDKVRLRNSNERLTQPGTIAIVYTQSKEAEEYEEYIRLLQRKNMLLSEVERLELEEVQGLSGLKAFRVTVML